MEEILRAYILERVNVNEIIHSWNRGTLHCQWELWFSMIRAREFLFKRQHSNDVWCFARTFALVRCLWSEDEEQGRTTCEDECAERTAKQERILPSPRTVRRELYSRTSRRRRLRPNTVYIYVFAQLDIYTACIIQCEGSHEYIRAVAYVKRDR